MKWCSCNKGQLRTYMRCATVLVVLPIAAGGIGLLSAQAEKPGGDYFLPPEGRIIKMPPPTWREKTLSIDPPNCGGTCHAPLGFREDELFLRAAETYEPAYKRWRIELRKMNAALARGGQMREYENQLRVGTDRISQAAGDYLVASAAYLEQLEARGVSLTRAQWITRLHGLDVP